MDSNKDKEAINKIKKSFEEKKFKLYPEDAITTYPIPLGTGSFGTVHKGVLEGKDVAIKLLDKLDFTCEEDTIKTILIELQAMTKVDHPRIPKFFGIWEKIVEGEIKFGLIFTFIPGRTLQKYMIDNGKDLKLSDKCDLIISLTEVIIEIHKQKVIHRDLKPENVMVTPEKEVIVLDFGISKISEKTVTYTNGKKMTPKYAPPENLAEFDEEKDTDMVGLTTKYDVWSLGCMLVEIYSGVVPWSNKFKDDHKILFAMTKKAKFEVGSKKEKYDYPYPKTFPDDFPEVFQVAKKCLLSNVKERINSEELLVELLKLKEILLKKEA